MLQTAGRAVCKKAGWGSKGRFAAAVRPASGGKAGRAARYAFTPRACRPCPSILHECFCESKRLHLYLNGILCYNENTVITRGGGIAMAWTQAQQDAIDARNDTLLVSAAAGSTSQASAAGR